MGQNQYTDELRLLKCCPKQHKNKQVSKTRYNVVDQPGE